MKHGFSVMYTLVDNPT